MCLICGFAWLSSGRSHDIGASDRLAEEQRWGVSRFPVAQGALRQVGKRSGPHGLSLFQRRVPVRVTAAPLNFEVFLPHRVCVFDLSRRQCRQLATGNEWPRIDGSRVKHAVIIMERVCRPPVMITIMLMMI